jgi:nicotinate-nucleotide adenylyltransferase
VDAESNPSLVAAGGPGERIGILGGTFDPIHNGHLHIARALKEALGLNRIIWVPAGRPPHKQGQIVSSDQDRLEMLRLALDGSPDNEISMVDLERAGPSYTADTLENLSKQLPSSRLFFLMGEDSLRDFPTWHDPDRIIRVADLAVAARPGVEADVEHVSAAVPEIRGRVHLVPAEELMISSSDVRRRVRAHQSIRGLVPPAIADYITRHHLYTATAMPFRLAK